MTPVETAQLLTVISKLDNRQPDADTVRIWAKLLFQIELPDALQAVQDHMASSTEYLMPIHIMRGVKAILAGRADVRRAGHDPVAVPAALVPATPGDNRRGVLVVNYVLAGLARERREAGRALGRDYAAGLGADLMVEALDRWPADGPVLPRRGVPCGRPACRCTHDVVPGSSGERCDGGWIEVMPPKRCADPVLIGEPDAVVVDPDAGRVRRCGTCDPVGSEIVAKVNGRRQVMAALRLRH